MPPDEPNTGTADGEAATSAQRSAISQEAAQQTLSKLLGSWTKVQTVKAAHPSMLPEDQQRVLDWMLQHKDVTILKFAKVIITLWAVSGSCVQQNPSFASLTSESKTCYSYPCRQESSGEVALHPNWFDKNSQHCVTTLCHRAKCCGLLLKHLRIHLENVLSRTRRSRGTWCSALSMPRAWPW